METPQAKSSTGPSPHFRRSLTIPTIPSDEISDYHFPIYSIDDIDKYEEMIRGKLVAPLHEFQKNFGNGKVSGPEVKKLLTALKAESNELIRDRPEPTSQPAGYYGIMLLPPAEELATENTEERNQSSPDSKKTATPAPSPEQVAQSRLAALKLDESYLEESLVQAQIALDEEKWGCYQGAPGLLERERRCVEREIEIAILEGKSGMASWRRRSCQVEAGEE